MEKNNFRLWHSVEYNPDSIIVAGPSTDYGIGVEMHECWPYLLEQMLDIPVYNLSVPGGSVDTCYRVLDTFLPIIQSKKIIAIPALVARREIINSHAKFNNGPVRNSIYIQIGSWSPDYQFLLDPEELELNVKRQRDAIASITREYNSELILLEYPTQWLLDPEHSFPHVHDYSKGTDNMHPGPDWHIAVAEYVRKHYFND